MHLPMVPPFNVWIALPELRHQDCGRSIEGCNSRPSISTLGLLSSDSERTCGRTLQYTAMHRIVEDLSVSGLGRLSVGRMLGTDFVLLWGFVEGVGGCGRCGGFRG